MERQTRTELDKIVMIGMGKIDQLVNQLCDDCVTPQIEVEKPEPIFDIDNLYRLYEQSRISQARALGLYDQSCDRSRLVGMQNAYNPFNAQRAAGQANLGMLGSVF